MKEDGISFCPPPFQVNKYMLNIEYVLGIVLTKGKENSSLFLNSPKYTIYKLLLCINLVMTTLALPLLRTTSRDTVKKGRLAKFWGEIDIAEKTCCWLISNFLVLFWGVWPWMPRIYIMNLYFFGSPYLVPNQFQHF